MRVLTYAYRKVGVHPRYAFAVLLLSLVGSHLNIPLFAMGPVGAARPTVVMLNVGGALIPIIVSIYLLARTGMYARMAIGTAVIAVIVYNLAEIVPGLGIRVPMIAPPLIAAGVALILAFRRAPPLAYVSGSMGTLVGADLLNLTRVAQIGAPVVSIGGAGTFDGVFLTGLIAGLLA
ncbi:MAG TPA: DUF1614 domain-containing protein [Haliangiales bacterium]|nr:DUF1614 domain-containing protein [Haliangiales bacterium]